MSYCYIYSPYTGDEITGGNGELVVIAYNNTGGYAYLNASCTRTSSMPPHVHELPWVALPHQPFFAYAVIYKLNHVSGGDTHMLNANMRDSVNYFLCNSTVYDVIIIPPDHPDGDMHDVRVKKEVESYIPWLPANHMLLPTDAMRAGYLSLDGARATLRGLVPGTVGKLQVTADLVAVRPLPNMRPHLTRFFNEEVKGGAEWAFPLTADKSLHGGTLDLTFTNPDEKDEKKKTLAFSILLLDPALEEKVYDESTNKSGYITRKPHHAKEPPVAVFRIPVPQPQ